MLAFTRVCEYRKIETDLALKAIKDKKNLKEQGYTETASDYIAFKELRLSKNLNRINKEQYYNQIVDINDEVLEFFNNKKYLADQYLKRLQGQKIFEDFLDSKSNCIKFLRGKNKNNKPIYTGFKGLFKYLHYSLEREERTKQYEESYLEKKALENQIAQQNKENKEKSNIMNKKLKAWFDLLKNNTNNNLDKKMNNMIKKGKITDNNANNLKKHIKNARNK